MTVFTLRKFARLSAAAAATSGFDFAQTLTAAPVAPIASEPFNGSSESLASYRWGNRRFRHIAQC